MIKRATGAELTQVLHEQCGELWNARALIDVLLKSWPVERDNYERRVVQLIEERLDKIQRAFDQYI